MSLHDVIVSDAKNLIINLNDFAESVTYHPRSGEPRTIRAVIDRQSYAGVSEDGSGYVLPIFEIHVANDASVGISSEELNLGGDFLVFSDRIGRETERRAINMLTSHDEGILVLQCR